MKTPLLHHLRIATGRRTRFLHPEWSGAERESLANGILGRPALDTVEKLESAMTDVDPHVVATSSGRLAIEAVVRASGLTPEAEVIIPSFSCAGVIQPLQRAGLVPVLVDVDERLCLDAEAAADAVTSRTEAVLFAHLGGVRAAAASELRRLADGRGLLLIEDMAQAAGLETVSEGEARGDVQIFSSGPGKPFFGPGGGWLTTTDKRMAERARGWVGPARPDDRASLAEFAARYLTGDQLGSVAATLRRLRPPRTSHIPTAMSPTEAAVALAQRGSLEDRVRRRRANADRWRGLIEPIQSLGCAPAESTCLKFWLRCDEPAARQQVLTVLRASGVGVESLYTPLHLRSEYMHVARTTHMPTTEALWRSVFSVPVRGNLDERDWDRISFAVRRMG